MKETVLWIALSHVKLTAQTEEQLASVNIG
jgi:hypothetical protein